MNKTELKSGFVTFIGRPNAGKSSLINALVGHKIAITSQTAQTTRHRFRAIITRNDAQLIMVDTPGLHKPHDALGEELNTSAIMAMEDTDVVAFVIDASAPIGRGDIWVASQLNAVKHSHKLLVVNKADRVSQEQMTEQLSRARSLCDFNDEIVVSAKTHFNITGLENLLITYLPYGPQWFPSDMDTDQPFEVLVAEFIREQILKTAHDEVPHSIGVITDSLEYDDIKDLYRMHASIYVERESQKGIIIGKGGAALKQVGISARLSLETLLGCKVYLNLQVKVKKNWRRDLNQIRRFGYGEGI